MRRTRRPALLVAVAAAVVVLCGCQAPAIGRDDVRPPGVPAPEAGAPTEVAEPGVRSIVVVGDSLTAGGEPIRGPGRGGEFSWLHGAVGPPLELRGGWATGGATTADMRAAAVPMAADVLVLMGGTNDLMTGRGWPDIRADLVAVAEGAGVEDVLLSAVPPHDALPEAATELNGQLRALAQEQGWGFVDPWSDVRLDGAYRPGASLDGIHPTPRVAAEAGVAIRAAVLDGVPVPVHRPS
ncbi:SGNH/GDSL hydrolase family protein [Blastococcus sp. SYSU DS1024]